MAAARIAAIALAITSCTVLSQQPAMSSLTVTVTDQTGAVIPGAQITAINPKSGLLFKATADRSGPSTGQATLSLDTGIVDLRVEARGFKIWENKNIELGAKTRRTVALRIDNDSIPCTSFCAGFLLVIPDEHSQPMPEIPLIALQKLVLPSKRLKSDCICSKLPQPVHRLAQPSCS